MRHSIPATMMTVAVLALAGLGVMACNVQQPPLGCPVQRLTWAARYNLVPGQTVTGACANKAGERLGIQTYNVPGTDQNQLVIKPDTLAKLDTADTAHPGYALGDFAAVANPEDFCVAPALSVAEKHVPASGTAPARDIVYQWTNVQVVSKAEAPGSQLVAELEYTDGGCTARYEVWAVWPSVSCADDDGNPSDALCAEPGRALNPEFALMCDPTQKRCVPAKRPPSFR